LRSEWSQIKAHWSSTHQDSSSSHQNNLFSAWYSLEYKKKANECFLFIFHFQQVLVNKTKWKIKKYHAVGTFLINFINLNLPVCKSYHLSYPLVHVILTWWHEMFLYLQGKITFNKLSILLVYWDHPLRLSWICVIQILLNHL
jgi:hypothetical protein